MSELLHTVAPPAVARPRRETLDARPGWVQSLTDDGPIDVSVCIANWNCADLLRRCLESLLDQPQGVRVEVVVVDNASADGAADLVAREFPEVVLLRNTENRGFAVASNQAAELSRGRFLFFLNNDTVVPAFALKKLVAFAEAHPDVGLIGPRLRGADGGPQVSYRRRPTLAALLHRTALFRWTGVLRSAYRRYRRGGFRPDRTRQVDLLMGAALFVPRAVYAECGGWDEGYPFGGEDLDLSARVSRGRPVVFLPTVEVLHYGRVSSRLNVGYAAPGVAIGYVRYLRKAGASKPAIWCYKAAVTVDAPVQIVEKLVQAGWRRLTGRPEKAAKSWLAAKGAWALMTRGLIEFWRA